MAYIKGIARDQSSLFPVSLEEAIPVDHLVRVIDAFVSPLDLQELRFDKAVPKGNGRPPYDPADLLKLFLYGYFLSIRSSRRLEAECLRNIEVMWLLNQLAPDFKTLCDFRRANGAAFAATCRVFVLFCREEGLIAGKLVAIDGSKFKAVASKRRHMSLKHLKRDEDVLDKKIARYLAELDQADKDDADQPVDKTKIKAALARLNNQRDNNLTRQEVMKALDVEQFISTESDAQMMRAPQGMAVAYNVQTAVDAEHSLILHYEVTQDHDDRKQLEPMAKAAKEVLQQAELTVVADAGYSYGKQLQACDDADITAYVPVNRTVNTRGGDVKFFDRTRFTFDAEGDRYTCPNGNLLTLTQVNKGLRIYHAEVGDCSRCPLKSQCTDATRRQLSRHAHEAAFERAEQRMQAHPEMMVARRSIVEHPFGNLKQWVMATGRFLLKQLVGARTEMALAVLAHNFKRVVNILGVRSMMARMA